MIKHSVLVTAGLIVKTLFMLFSICNALSGLKIIESKHAG